MKPHDQFAKNYLEQLLSPLGIVEISKEVSDETRQIDLFFSPNPEPNPDYLGLLGRIVLNTVLIEPYRNPPNRSEIRNCLAKLLAILAELQRQAKRENQSYNEDNAPRLWILSPSAGIFGSSCVSVPHVTVGSLRHLELSDYSPEDTKYFLASMIFRFEIFEADQQGTLIYLLVEIKPSRERGYS